MSSIAGRVAIVPKGNFGSSVQYNKLDAVGYANGTYLAKDIPPVGTLPTDTEHWMKMVEGQNDYVTPQMFGGKTDNTDCTLAIESAIEYASVHGTYVFFPSGTYILTRPIKILKEVSLVGSRRLRTSSGVILRFKGMKSNESCIVIGTENNDVTSRAKRINISNIFIRCDEVEGVVGTSCVSVGDVSGLNMYNVTLYNSNMRTSEYTDAEIDNPTLCSNYGLKFNGDSEILVFSSIGITADIPIYSVLPPDFAMFESIATDCGGYGYANYYGASLCGNTTIQHASLNRGLYGVKFISDTLTRLSGVFNMESFRIEQLRRLVLNNKLVSCNFVLFINSKLSIPRNYNIENGKLDGNGNGVYVTGGASMNYFPSSINFNGISGIRQSYSSDYLLDMTTIENPVVRVNFNKCNLYNGGFISVNENANAFTDIYVVNQSNSSVYPMIRDLSVDIAIKPNTIRQNRYKKSGTGTLSQHFEYYSVKNDSVNAWLTEIIDSRTNNKTIGFVIEFTIIGETLFSKYSVSCKYGSNDSGIDTSTVTLTGNLIAGEDIVNVIGTVDNKFNFIKKGTNEYGAYFGISNKTGENLQINADITLFEQS